MSRVMIVLNLNKEYLTDDLQYFYPQELTHDIILRLVTVKTIHQA